MADNPPGTPPDFAQGGAGTPPNSAATSVNEALSTTVQNLSKAIGVMTDNMGKFLDNLNDAAEPSKTLTTNFDKWSLQLRTIVDYSENYADSFKELLALSKKFATSGIFDAKNFGDAKRRIEVLQKAQEALLKKGMFNVKEQSDIRKGIEKLGDSLKILDKGMVKLGKTTEDAIDPDVWVAVAKQIKSAASEAEKLNDKFRQLTPLAKGVRGITQAIGRPGRVDKFAGYAQTAYNLKETQKSRQQGNQEEFKKKRERMVEGLKKRGMDFDERGRIKSGERQRKRGTEFFKDAAETMSGKGKYSPTGFIDRKIGKRVLAKMAGGEEVGFGTRLGGKLMGMGGGSLTRGIGQGAVGLAEGGLGGISSLMGRAAIPLAIAGLVKDVFDKTAKMNQQVEKTLGEAGIFAGPEKGQQALQNVRTNLTPKGLKGVYDPLGETYERNLKIAQAISESGINLSELATGGTQGGKGFQSIKQTTMVGARLVGLDEAAATKQQIKLLQQYKQSFEASDAFFTKIQKDTYSAGITTSKYIQIIDEVTGQFDHMNRSLNEVTETMRVLGRTGRFTSEDLKDAMDTLTNSGQQRTMEVKTYLAQQMASNPETMARMEKGQAATTEIAKDNTRKAFAKAGVDVTDLKLDTPQDVAKARQRLADKVGVGPGTIETQTAGTILANLDQETARLEQVRRLKQHPSGAGALGYVAGEEITGQSFSQKAMETVQALQTQLKAGGFKLSDLTENREKVFSDPRMMMLAKTFQSDPQMYQKMMNIIAATSNVTIGEAKKGTLAEDEYEKLAALMKKSGQFEMGTGTAKEQVQRVLSTGKGREDTAVLLQKNNDTLVDIAASNTAVKEAVNKEAAASDAAERVKKATEIAVATRPTADIFADAFTNLFNQLTRPLTFIASFLEDHFGGPKASKDTMTGLTTWLNSPAVQKQTDAITASVADLGSQISEKKTQLQTPGLTDDDRKKKQAELDTLEAKQNKEKQALIDLDTYKGQIGQGKEGTTSEDVAEHLDKTLHTVTDLGTDLENQRRLKEIQDRKQPEAGAQTGTTPNPVATAAAAGTASGTATGMAKPTNVTVNNKTTNTVALQVHNEVNGNNSPANAGESPGMTTGAAPTTVPAEPVR